VLGLLWAKVGRSRKGHALVREPRRQTLQNAEGKTMESADKIPQRHHHVVDSATKRLRDATEEIGARRARSRATRLTRAELKKGVIEMPEEAKESTSAIRRAVSERSTP